LLCTESRHDDVQETERKQNVKTESTWSAEKQQEMEAVATTWHKTVSSWSAEKQTRKESK